MTFLLVWRTPEKSGDPSVPAWTILAAKPVIFPNKSVRILIPVQAVVLSPAQDITLKQLQGPEDVPNEGNPLRFYIDVSANGSHVRLTGTEVYL